MRQTFWTMVLWFLMPLGLIAMIPAIPFLLFLLAVDEVERRLQ